MTDDEMDKLAITFAKVLQQARSVSDSEHHDHHVWIKARIDAEKAKLLFWDDMRRHMIKWGAVSIVSTAGYALYLGLRQLLKAT